MCRCNISNSLYTPQERADYCNSGLLTARYRSTCLYWLQYTLKYNFFFCFSVTVMFCMGNFAMDRWANSLWLNDELVPFGLESSASSLPQCAIWWCGGPHFWFLSSKQIIALLKAHTFLCMELVQETSVEGRAWCTEMYRSCHALRGTITELTDCHLKERLSISLGFLRQGQKRSG